MVTEEVEDMKEVEIILALCLLLGALLLVIVSVHLALKRPRENMIYVGHFLLLRTIHASWILLPPAFLFTIMFSPYIFFKYYISESINSILTFIFAFVSIAIGYKVGEKLIEKVYLHTIQNKKILWFSCILPMGLFIMVMAMDILLVIEESWNWMYSVILLFISVLILVLPLIRES